MDDDAGREDTTYLALIRVWAATAWADGRMAPAEAAAIAKLIAAAPLGEAQRAAAAGFLAAPVGLETGELEGLAPEQREGIYRAAVRLAMIDRDVAPEEASFLTRLQRNLGIDDATARSIERSVAPAPGAPR